MQVAIERAAINSAKIVEAARGEKLLISFLAFKNHVEKQIWEEAFA